MHEADDDQERIARLHQLFESVLRPQILHLVAGLDRGDSEHLQEALDGLDFAALELPEDFADLAGEAVVVGSREEHRIREVLATVQAHLREGLPLEYILRELTGVSIRATASRSFGNLKVNVIQIEAANDDVAIPSAEDLQRLFGRP